MKFNFKQRKGITLVALVITIIILLILAGISVQAITQTGLLAKAENAKVDSEIAKIKEEIGLKIYEKQLEPPVGEITDRELATILSQYGDVTYGEDGTISGIAIEGYDISLSDIYTGTLDEFVPEEGTVLYDATQAMPEGAKIIATTNETTGIVMIDSKGNEWVWVEVPKTVFTTATSATDYDNIKADLIEYATDYRSSWTDEWYDYYGTTYDGENEYSQVKYITSAKNDSTAEEYFTDAKNYYGTIYTDAGETEATSYTSGTTYYAKITDKINDISGCGLTYVDYNTAYKKMLSSVYINKGFYISRYEAGIAGSDTDTSLARTTHTAITTSSPEAVSKIDMIPYNHIYCSEAQTLASSMSAEVGKTSSLLFGIQWDLVCKFLEVRGDWDTQTNTAQYYIKSNSTSWGNYSYNTFTINSSNAKSILPWSTRWEAISGKKSQMKLLTTGASEYTKKMNIYDFAGNFCEWTLELASDYSYYPSCSRGVYDGYGDGSDDNRSASFRGEGVANESYKIGYRVSLY